MPRNLEIVPITDTINMLVSDLSNRRITYSEIHTSQHVGSFNSFPFLLDAFSPQIGLKNGGVFLKTLKKKSGKNNSFDTARSVQIIPKNKLSHFKHFFFHQYKGQPQSKSPASTT